MSDMVKLIFKIIIITVVGIVVSSLVIEMYNITTTSMQINRLADLAVSQSCELYAQETYKARDGGSSGSVGIEDIVDNNGNVLVSGRFYGSGGPDEIYDRLYRNSRDFRDWCGTDEISRKVNWLSLKVLNNSLTGSGAGEYAQWKESGDFYVESKMTPLNMGIPYIDKETLQKMARWNVARILSVGESNSVYTTESGVTGGGYILFKGFKIYAQDITIDEMEYKVFDLGVVSQAEEYSKITGIGDGGGVHSGLGSGSTDSMLVAGNDERSRVCVLGVKYSLKVRFEGITPINNIFKFVWNNEVEGLDGTGEIANKQQWNDESVSGSLGGFGSSSGSSGVLPVESKVTYYIVR